MKTKQEIEEKLKIYEQINDNSSIFTSEFTLSSGAITALKWVLEIDEVKNDRRFWTNKNRINSLWVTFTRLWHKGNIWKTFYIITYFKGS